MVQFWPKEKNMLGKGGFWILARHFFSKRENRF
jgi:hypothetical protein